MSVDVRKLVITSRFGLAFLFGVPFGVTMLLINGVHDPVSFVISIAVGMLFGLVMSASFRSKNSYFIENIRADRYDDTKKFTKMFKAGKVPDTSEEQAAYRQYLSGLQKLNSRSVKGEYAGLAFLISIFIVSIVIDRRLSVLTMLFGFVVLFAVYGFWKSQKNLQKIDQLKKEMKHNRTPRA